MRSRRKRSVFLIGFMGSGKTRVGRALARRLGCRFVDTDAEIERVRGLSVRRIFAGEGEAAFRRMESKAIARACRGRCRVVAVGGGAVTRPGNVAAMRRAGKVVYLQAPLVVLGSRVGRRGARRRPLWSDAARLWARRRPLYRKAAHLTVRAGRGTPARIAERIARRLEAS